MVVGRKLLGRNKLRFIINLAHAFPRSARQCCMAHRMRNLATNVAADFSPEFKAHAGACYQATSPAVGADYADLVPSARLLRALFAPPSVRIGGAIRLEKGRATGYE
jgi:hypothetical protein